MTRRPAPAGLAPCALALALAGCGGDDGTRAPDPRSTTTTAAATAEAEEVASALVLAADDFAAGWTAVAPRAEDDPTRRCIGTVDLARAAAATSHSPTFAIATEDGRQTQVVQSSTVVLADATTAAAVVREAATDGFAACAEAALVTALAGAGIDVTGPDLRPAPDEVGRPDDAAGVAGPVVHQGPDGTRQDARLALHVVRTGAVVTALTVLDVGGLGLDDTLADLVDEVRSRHAVALG